MKNTLLNTPETSHTAPSSNPIMNAYYKDGQFGFWSAIRIAIVLLLIVGAFGLGAHHGRIMQYADFDDNSYRNHNYRGDMMHNNTVQKINTIQKNTPIMSMSDSPSMNSRNMPNMAMMLAGKTGEALDRAFLEGMIPHHQAAVDMARYMSGSTHPELIKLATDIIASQSREIEQMKQWQIVWGFSATGTTNTGIMMNQGMSSGTIIR